MATGDGVDVVDVREAAVLVARTPETIRRWVWAGRLPAVRRGGRLLITRSDLEAAAASAPGGGTGSGLRAPTWADWVELVDRARTTGAVPAGTSSSADLVLADRAARDS